MINIDCLVSFFSTLQIIDDLDIWIKEFSMFENGLSGKALLKECIVILKQGEYEQLATTMNTQIGTKHKPHTAELFVKYLYNRLTNTPTEMTAQILGKIH